MAETIYSLNKSCIQFHLVLCKKWTKWIRCLIVTNFLDQFSLNINFCKFFYVFCRGTWKSISRDSIHILSDYSAMRKWAHGFGRLSHSRSYSLWKQDWCCVDITCPLTLRILLFLQVEICSGSLHNTQTDFQ